MTDNGKYRHHWFTNPNKGWSVQKLKITENFSNSPAEVWYSLAVNILMFDI